MYILTHSYDVLLVRYTCHHSPKKMKTHGVSTKCNEDMVFPAQTAVTQHYRVRVRISTFCSSYCCGANSRVSTCVEVFCATYTTIPHHLKSQVWGVILTTLQS